MEWSQFLKLTYGVPLLKRSHRTIFDPSPILFVDSFDE